MKDNIIALSIAFVLGVLGGFFIRPLVLPCPEYDLTHEMELEAEKSILQEKYQSAQDTADYWRNKANTVQTDTVTVTKLIRQNEKTFRSVSLDSVQDYLLSSPTR